MCIKDSFFSHSINKNEGSEGAAKGGQLKGVSERGSTTQLTKTGYLGGGGASLKPHE